MSVHELIGFLLIELTRADGWKTERVPSLEWSIGREDLMPSCCCCCVVYVLELSSRNRVHYIHTHIYIYFHILYTYTIFYWVWRTGSSSCVGMTGSALIGC